MNRKPGSERRLLAQLEHFRFFEKEAWLRDLERALLLLAGGCALAFLTRAPGAEWRPLLVNWGDGFFRYSVFGNLLLALGYHGLAGTETPGSLMRALALLGIPLSLAHGVASFLDPLALFRTDALLELAMLLLPLVSLFRYLFRLPVPARAFSITGGLLTAWLALSLLTTRFLGTAGAFTNVPLLRLAAFQGAWEAATRARLLTALLGVLLAGGLLVVRHHRRRLLPGFVEMENHAYGERNRPKGP